MPQTLLIRPRDEIAMNLPFLQDWADLGPSMSSHVIQRSYVQTETLLFLQCGDARDLLNAVEKSKKLGWRIININSLRYGGGGDETLFEEEIHFAYLELSSPGKTQ